MTLSLAIVVLAAWWLVTVALATGAFTVRRPHPQHHHEEGKHQSGCSRFWPRGLPRRVNDSSTGLDWWRLIYGKNGNWFV